MTIFAFNRGFVFVSNTRAASTTIHHLLFRSADLVFYRPEFGKHFTFPQITRRVRSTGGLKITALFTFGIVREPISWLYSWYRFRRRDGLKRASGPERANAVPEEVGFGEFVEEACSNSPRPFARIQRQSSYFRDAQGDIAVNFIASYDNLVEDMLCLSALPSLDRLAGISRLHVNMTPGRDEPQFASKDFAGLLTASFDDDLELYERAAGGEFKTIPREAIGTVCRPRPDDQEKREDAMSRISLHFALNEYDAAAKLLPELDLQGRSDERMQWMAAQLASKSDPPSGLHKLLDKLGVRAAKGLNS